MERQKNGFTVIGKLFGTISNLSSILSYIGIPIAVFLAIFRKYSFAIFIAIFLLLIRIVIYVCFKRRDDIIKFILRQFAPKSPYCYSRWESTYEYKSLDTMAFHTRYLVKAMQAGVDHIRVRFNWSGATESNPIHPKPAKTDGCTTQRIEFSGDEYGYKYYNVYNRTAINKGDQEVKLGVDIENMKVTNKKSVSHHLLTSVSVITEVLHMKVLLPPNIYPANVVAHEYLHACDDNHWRDRSSECAPVRQDDGKWVISWEIKKPVFGGKYIIYWDPQLTTD